MSDIATKLTTIAENQQKVYDAGKQAEYDAFWDAIQDNGNRTYYFAAFTNWTDEIFKPKYDIVPVGQASNMFAYARIKYLATCIENAGIVFDTSKATNLGYLFNAAMTLVEAPIVDATGSSNVDRLFNQCGSLKKAAVIFPENKLTTYTNMFAACSDLEDFTAGGVIDIPLVFSACPKLSKASHISIINALSATKSDIAITFSNKAVNKAFETSEGANDGSTSDEWTALIATKPNWTLTLV